MVDRRTVQDVCRLLSGEASVELRLKALDPESDVRNFVSQMTAMPDVHADCASAIDAINDAAQRNRGITIEKWDVMVQQLDEALEAGSFHEGLRIAERLADAAADEFGWEDDRTLERHAVLAHTLSLVGKGKRAEELAEKIVSLYLETKGSMHRGTVITTAVLAKIYEDNDRLMDAAVHYFKSWQGARYLKGEGIILVRSLLGNARCEMKQHNYDLAYRIASMPYSAVQDLPTKLPQEHAQIQNVAGLVRLAQSKYREASEHLTVAYQQAVTAFHPANPLRLKITYNAALAASHVGVFVAAEELYKEVIARTGPMTAGNLGYKALGRLAELYLKTDKYSNAREAYCQIAAAVACSRDTAPMEYSQTLNNLAVAKQSLGEFQEAEKDYLTALAYLREQISKPAQQLVSNMQAMIDSIEDNLRLCAEHRGGAKALGVGYGAAY